MIKKGKRLSDKGESERIPSKKIKTDTAVKVKDAHDKSQNKHNKFPKTGTQLPQKINKYNSGEEKPDWVEFKKEKKELKLKRKQSKGFYDVMIEAKAIGEKLRQKQIKGDSTERNQLVSQLHNLLDGKNLYAKLVFAHDMARVVQYLLKFGSENIRNNIAKELIPLSTEMLMSKYGRYCFKNMLKYGNSETRSSALTKLYGNAIKLTSHVVSSTVFEYAYTNWASQRQKQHLIQEFFGDMYKQSKDDDVKHLRDVYKNNDSMKTAALSATKANLSRVFNKNLFDSGLVQSILYQYISECSTNDKTELIAQLVQHAVVLSNSRDGARVVMQCIWYGSNKDRKSIIKVVKEHVLELSKHEYGHCVVITLLDTVDDTVLLNKSLVSQIVTNATDLVTNEWGRKVLLWLVTPADAVHFHPTFVNELNVGRDNSTSRKDANTRRIEVVNYCSADLLQYVVADAQFWLSTSSIAVVTLAILKSCDNITAALQSIVQIILDPDWKITDNDKHIPGIEHSGLHMALKKLAQYDKVTTKTTFGEVLFANINEHTIKSWLQLNRGCFLLVTVYENSNIVIQQQMKEKFAAHMKFLKKQSSTGSKILLEKLL